MLYQKNQLVKLKKSMNNPQLFGEACSLIGSIPHTTISYIWKAISYVFSNYWYIVVPILIIWIIIEIITRNTHGYNSGNGFTPTFNSFIGGGIYYISNALISLILNFLFGPITSCTTLWIGSFYIIPFITTALFLHWIGFWPYMRNPFTKEKIKLF